MAAPAGLRVVTGSPARAFFLSWRKSHALVVVRLWWCACFYLPPHIVHFKSDRLKKHDARREGVEGGRACWFKGGDWFSRAGFFFVLEEMSCACGGALVVVRLLTFYFIFMGSLLGVVPAAAALCLDPFGVVFIWGCPPIPPAFGVWGGDNISILFL